MVDEDEMRDHGLAVLYYPVGHEPEIRLIPNTLGAMQALVGGDIETFHLFDRVSAVCNEQGKLVGLAPNRQIGNEVICGPFFVASSAGEDFADLSDVELIRAVVRIGPMMAREERQE